MAKTERFPCIRGSFMTKREANPEKDYRGGGTDLQPTLLRIPESLSSCSQPRN